MDSESVLEDRIQGMSLNELARKRKISKGSICKTLKEGSKRVCHKPLLQTPLEPIDSTSSYSSLLPV
jgi:hypothetical protein